MSLFITSFSGPVEALAALSVAFALKHYAADFVFQTNWMAHGKERMQGWVLPMLSHAGCHAAMTLALVLFVAPALWWLALIDFAVHVAVDRSKTAVSHWGKWQPSDKHFWWLLGFDQFLHQVTNIVLATIIVLH